MKLEEIRSLAKSQSIRPGKLAKNTLIKSIQVEEGNFDCFGSAFLGACDQSSCIWRADCFQVARQGAPS